MSKKFTYEQFGKLLNRIYTEHPDFFKKNHMPWSIGIRNYFFNLYPDVDPKLLCTALAYLTGKRLEYLRSFFFNEHRYNLETQTHSGEIDEVATLTAFGKLQKVIATDAQIKKFVNFCKFHEKDLLSNHLLSIENKKLILTYIDNLKARIQHIEPPKNALPEPQDTPTIKKTIIKLKPQVSEVESQKLSTEPKIIIKKKIAISQPIKIIEIIDKGTHK